MTTFALSFSQLKTRVRTDFGFDITDEKAGEWVNEAYNDLAVKSRWSAAILSLGTTVAAQHTYDLSTSAAVVEALRVGGQPYGPISIDEIWDLTYGNAVVDSNVFAQTWGDDGTAKFMLWPTPEDAGADIEAKVIFYPSTLEADTDVPKVPSQFHKSIAKGAIGMGLEIDAQRKDLAAPFLEEFERAITELRVFKNSHFGHRTMQAKIQGVHY